MTAPTGPGTGLDSATIAELNDLLQLDHDAVAAYTLAIGALTNVGRRETVIRFRADHERHVAELSRAIRRHGGTPAEGPHAGSAGFKLAMQRLGTLGGDREVMVAFKSNEAIVCETYTRAVTKAGGWPEDVRAIVTAAADDEARHFEWAEDQIDTLGGAPVATVVEKVHGGVAAAAEQVERGARAVRERLPDRLPELDLPQLDGRVLAVGAVAAGIAFLVTAAISRSLRGR